MSKSEGCWCDACVFDSICDACVFDVNMEQVWMLLMWCMRICVCCSWYRHGVHRHGDLCILVVNYTLLSFKVTFNFFDGKTNLGLGRTWSFVLIEFSITCRAARAICESRNKECGFYWQRKSVNSLRISASQWWPFKKGETGSVQGETKSTNFWRGKV